MKRLFWLIFICFLVPPPTAFSAEKGLTVKGVRYFSYATFTRIVFEIEAPAPYVLTKAADSRSLLFSSYDGLLTVKTALPPVRDGVVAGIDARENAGRTLIVIRLDAAAGETKDFVLRGPDRIVLDIAKGAAPSPPAVARDRPVVIVLDAGHGGKDTGIVTAKGQEKNFALDLVQAIRRILQKDPGLMVVLSRDRDTALTLDERAAAANAAGARVYVSIHAADEGHDRVYIQDPDEDQSPRAQHPASRDFLGFEAGSEQLDRLWGRQQAAHTKESSALGRLVARKLAGNDGAEPTQAPLAGLKAVDAAAVLVEAGMEQDRTKTAAAVAEGIEWYVREDRSEDRK